MYESSVLLYRLDTLCYFTYPYSIDTVFSHTLTHDGYHGRIG